MMWQIGNTKPLLAHLERQTAAGKAYGDDYNLKRIYDLAWDLLGAGFTQLPIPLHDDGRIDYAELEQLLKGDDETSRSLSRKRDTATQRLIEQIRREAKERTTERS